MEPMNLARRMDVRKSLTYSIWDGLFYSIMAGFGEWFFIPFAIFMGLTNMHIALLNSLPQFFGSISQIVSLYLMRLFPSRRLFVVTTASLQACTHLILASLFLIKSHTIVLIFLAIILYWIFAMMGGPAWNSWMGDLVEVERKGSYFGKRNLVVGITLMVSFIGAGVILQVFSDGFQKQWMGFLILFIVAFLGRVLSVSFLSRQYEPKYVERKSKQFSFIGFLQQMSFRKFGLLALYMCLINFAVAVSAPFFTAYMLKDLHFSYITFTLITAASLLVKYLMMPVWGMYADKYGSRIALTISGFAISVIPIAWVFSKSLVFITIVQIVSGFVWAGYELASFNFMFDTTSRQKRARCFAYYNALNGFFVLAGGIVGGIIVKYNAFFWTPYLFVFIVSGALRLLFSAIMLPKIKEVRQVDHISYKEFLFKMLSIKTIVNADYTSFLFNGNNGEEPTLERKIRKVRR